MYKKIIFLFLSGCISCGAFSQDLAQFKRLDSLITILESANKLMGTLAVSQHDSIIYSRSFGIAKMTPGGENAKNNEETIFRIGSVSQIFTAAMILHLIEQGQLKLTTPLSDFYPQLPNANKITIADLLNQHSGLSNFSDDSTYVKWFTSPRTEDDMLAFFVLQRPNFRPGEKGGYSNTNYVLLGYILEKITKKPYKEALASMISEKAGLKSTFQGAKINKEENEAQSYNFSDGVWRQGRETDLSVTDGAGSIISTSKDLARFITALFGYKLVSKQSLKDMRTIQGGFGMGLSQLSFYDYSLYGSIGTIDDFTSGVCYFPREGISIAFTSNGLNIPANDFFIGVLSILFNKPYTMPIYTISLTKEELQKFEGIYSCTLSSMPLKITIRNGRYNLTAQVSGQEAFPLDIVNKSKFKFDPAGVIIEFPNSGTMAASFTLTQAGANYTFNREH